MIKGLYIYIHRNRNMYIYLLYLFMLNTWNPTPPYFHVLNVGLGHLTHFRGEKILQPKGSFFGFYTFI